MPRLQAIDRGRRAPWGSADSIPRAQLETGWLWDLPLDGARAGTKEQLVAVHSLLPPGCVFSRLSAARLHGFDTDRSTTVEVIAPPGVSVRASPDRTCSMRRPGLRSSTTGPRTETASWRTIAARTVCTEQAFSSSAIRALTFTTGPRRSWKRCAHGGTLERAHGASEHAEH